MRKNHRKIDFFIGSGASLACVGVVARALNSHAIRPLLLEKQTLDNYNLAADYLVVHGIALVGVALLTHLFPAANYHRAGFAFIAGSLLFQCSVLAKSWISLHPFGFITPLGGFLLIIGWALIAFCALTSFYRRQQ